MSIYAKILIERCVSKNGPSMIYSILLIPKEKDLSVYLISK